MNKRWEGRFCLHVFKKVGHFFTANSQSMFLLAYKIACVAVALFFAKGLVFKG